MSHLRVLLPSLMRAISADGLEGVQTIVSEVIASGFADDDYSALYNAVNPLEEP